MIIYFHKRSLHFICNKGALMRKSVFLKSLASVLVISLVISTIYILENQKPTKASTGIMMSYLTAVTTNSVYLLVESDSENPVTVDYGKTNSYGMEAISESIESTSGGTYIHNVK